MAIRAVVFDIGGVMIEICHTWSEACRVAEIVPLRAPEPDRLALSSFLDDYQASAVTPETYLETLAEHLGLGDSESARLVHNSILRVEVPGVLGVVQDLKSAGLQTACLSNTAQWHWEEMHRAERFPAFSLLDARFASHIEEMNKPAREIYDRVAERLGVLPGEILFFEDTKPNILGAEAAGWDPVWIDVSIPVEPQMRAALAARGL